MRIILLFFKIYVCALLTSHVTALISKKQFILSKVFVFIFLDRKLSHNISTGIMYYLNKLYRIIVMWLSVWMYVKTILKLKCFLFFIFHVRCIIYVIIVVNFVLFCIRKKRDYCSIWLIYFPLPLEIR